MLSSLLNQGTTTIKIHASSEGSCYLGTYFPIYLLSQIQLNKMYIVVLTPRSTDLPTYSSKQIDFCSIKLKNGLVCGFVTSNQYS